SNRLLHSIRELGCGAGVAINPATPVEGIEELRGYADLVLCMTINPGWGGQQLLESSYDKLERLAPLVGDARIEVDGGVDVNTAGRLAAAGAHLFVAGSAVFGADDPPAAYAQIADAAGAS
ncbi:MAG TPA: ribulose-phosphate 3-epimerase, partial [Solirubrobacterales bacterium]|nr:ribulose-phosphate 3-epimerase [Solirubrobacterales bacterium]